jgi:hypothetical protein
MLLALLASCVSPTDYGAVPDDRGDDAPAFQRAIDHALAQRSGGELCVPPGVWNLARTAGHMGSIEVTGPITIRGAGPRTVLRMSGPGHRRAWGMIDVRGAHDVVIRDLTIDGLDATDTKEQTHLIELAPGTHDVVISHVTLGPMRRPDQRIGDGIGGDCLHLLGEVGHEVADVTVADSQFVDCDRSGVGFQRALRDIALIRNTITGTGDTSIDFEPTGRGAIEDVAMVDLTIRHPPLAQSAWAITLAGVGEDLARRLLVERSTLDGGGIGLLNVADVEIADNQITAHPRAGPKPTISVIRRGSNIRVIRNTISRPASSEPGFLFRAEHNNGQVPHDITIADNTLEQATSHPVIGAISVSGLVVRHNVIDLAPGVRGTAVVQASAVIADVAGVTVENNDVHGASGSLVAASVRGDHKLSAVAVRGNRAGDIAALRCEGPVGAFSAVTTDQPVLDVGCGGMHLIGSPASGSAPAPPPR